jgi:hypothetical protein
MLKPEKDGRFYTKPKKKAVHICSGCRVIYKTAPGKNRKCPNCLPVNVEMERLCL